MLSTYNVSGYEFQLEVKESVFTPTSTTRKMADHLSVTPGSDVLDLGCGSGPLAILAAMMGARHVYAVDVMEEAVELTRQNAARNNLEDKVTVRCGSLFEAVEGLKFDLIIDDVSGVADRVARISPWFPPPVPTGGEDGTDLIISVLTEAPAYMNPGARLLFPVLSLSNATKIIEHAKELYKDKVTCLASYNIPFCAELNEAVEELERLKEEGLITFRRMGSRVIWTLDVWQVEYSG